MIEFKQAEPTNLYLELLIKKSEEIWNLYQELLTDYAKLTKDEELFNAFISAMIVYTDQIIAKLEGSGDKAKSLLGEFEDFKSWLDDISVPKLSIEETKKVHKLYRLITKANELLGISNI